MTAPIAKRWSKQLFQIQVKAVTHHESYKKSPWQTSNDIALIRLTSPAHLAPNVIPVCLPVQQDEVQVRGFTQPGTLPSSQTLFLSSS